MPTSPRLAGGGRFRLEVSGDPAVVTKHGPSDAIAREVDALRQMAGTGLAPLLVDHTADSVTMTYIAGEPRPPAGLGADDARRLGASLRRLHDARHATVGGRHVWDGPADSLAAYARARLADLEPVPDGLRSLADTVGERLLRDTGTGPPAFRFLHGDLAADNILWTPAPVFVDWEFWRMGDPAEDLAYLITMNDTPPPVTAAMLEGYGDADVRVRIEAWYGATALDAGLWYLRQGDRESAERMITRARAAPGR